MIVSTVIIVPLHTFVAKTKPNQTKGSNNISQRLSNQVVNKLIIPELTGVVSFRQSVDLLSIIGAQHSHWAG